MELDKVDALGRTVGQLNLTQQSDATPNDPSCAPAGTTDEVNQTRSLVLSLAGEIKNHVFEIVVPCNTAIILRAEQGPTATGKRHYRFHPKSAALYATCRQLRADFPIAEYYAGSSFVFTDSMFQPGAISAFIKARKPAVEDTTHVRVSHTLRPHVNARTVTSRGRADC